MGNWKNEVTLKSLKKTRWGMSYPCVTYAKVPINMQGDFYMSVTLKPSKVDIDHPVGFVFNNVTSNQHNLICFDGQFCTYPFNERATYKKMKFNSPCVGAYAVNKGEVKILEVSYEQWAAPAENEE